MDVKEFMAAPPVALTDLGILASEKRGRQLLELADQLSCCKSQLKEAKKNKADVARQFKVLNQVSAERDQLITAMQAVSAEVKNLEEQLRWMERSLSSLLQQATSQSEMEPPFVVLPQGSNYSEHYIIRELLPSEAALWSEFLSSKRTSAYHQPAWPKIIERSFGHQTRIWVAVAENGKILGGLPLTFFASKLFGRFAVSIPYFNYGGIISDWFNVAKEMISHLQQICIDEGLAHIEVRTMQPDLYHRFSDKKASMVLVLPDTESELDDQLGAKVRAQYKKAEEHRPQVKYGRGELLSDFYRVFAQNMRDLGTPVYARRWFANILSEATINARVIVVYVDKKPVSAGFMIGHGNMLEIPWASTVKQANSMNTNMWMYRQILGYAVREGYQYFDFGRSTRDAGTYRFKKQWGAKPFTHYWYYQFPAGGVMPELNPDNPKYKLMIAIWKRLPVWLTKIIGPPVVANLP